MFVPVVRLEALFSGRSACFFFVKHWPGIFICLLPTGTLCHGAPLMQWTPTMLTCVVPSADVAGVVPVTLLLASAPPATAASASSCPSFLDIPTGLVFTYTAPPPPMLLSISPIHGPPSGGTVVTLLGVGLGASLSPRVALLARLARGREVELPLIVTAFNDTHVVVIMVRGAHSDRGPFAFPKPRLTLSMFTR